MVGPIPGWFFKVKNSYHYQQQRNKHIARQWDLSRKKLILVLRKHFLEDATGYNPVPVLVLFVVSWCLGLMEPL